MSFATKITASGDMVEVNLGGENEALYREIR